MGGLGGGGVELLNTDSSFLLEVEVMSLKIIKAYYIA